VVGFAPNVQTGAVSAKAYRVKMKTRGHARQRIAHASTRKN
jgi:hypothetical protein